LFVPQYLLEITLPSGDQSIRNLSSSLDSTFNITMSQTDFAISRAKDIIDLICTIVYEMNGEPLLSPSLNADDALSMLK